MSRLSPVLLALALTGCAQAAQAPRTVPPSPVPGPAQGMVDEGWVVIDGEHGKLAAARTWTLAGKAQKEAGVTFGGDSLFNELVAAKGQEPALQVQSSKQMICYAREQAAFWSKHQAAPSEGIERYMAGACGVWGYRPYLFHKKVEGGDAQAVRDALRKALSAFPAAGVYGVATTGPGADKAVWLTVAYDATPFRWEAVPLSVPGREHLELTAKPLIQAKFEEGLALDGYYAWKECSGGQGADASTTTLRCAVNKSDKVSFIDVSNSVGSDGAQGPLFRVAVFGPDGVSAQFTEGLQINSRAKGPMSDPAKLLMALNEMRRRAGMPRINSDVQLGLRIDEWWRKPEAKATRAAFFERSGAYHAAGTDQGASGARLVIASFILPKGLSAAEGLARALEFPKARTVLLSSLIKTIAIRQYELEGRDAMETMVAAYLR